MMRKPSIWLSWLIVLLCLTGIIADNTLFTRINAADQSGPTINAGRNGY